MAAQCPWCLGPLEAWGRGELSPQGARAGAGPAEQERGFRARLGGRSAVRRPGLPLFSGWTALGAELGTQGWATPGRAFGSLLRSEWGDAVLTLGQAHRLSAKSGPVFRGYLTPPPRVLAALCEYLCLKCMISHRKR